jgi:hypothetical protein
MRRAAARATLVHMPDPDVATIEEEPDDEPRFDVHEWFEAYLAQEPDVVEALVGVPLN